MQQINCNRSNQLQWVPLISFLSLKFLLDVALYSTARKCPLLIIHIFALRTDAAVAQSDNPWNRGNPEAEMSGLRLNRTSGVTSPRGLPMEMIWLCGNDLQAKAQISTEPDHFHRQSPWTSYI